MLLGDTPRTQNIFHIAASSTIHRIQNPYAMINIVDAIKPQNDYHIISHALSTPMLTLESQIWKSLPQPTSRYIDSLPTMTRAPIAFKIMDML